MKFSDTSALANSTTKRNRAFFTAFFALLTLLAIPTKLMSLHKKSNLNLFSTTHTKIISSHKKATNQYIWIKNSCPKFKEIIPSWNALRPRAGRFIFSVSCLVNGEWTGWKRIAVWGKNEQLTYSKSISPRLHTKHVRAEVPNPYTATGFRIKVTASHGAKLSNLDALFCTTSNSHNFKREHGPLNLPTLRISGLTAQSQMEVEHPRKQDLCAPTAISIVTQYLNRNKKKNQAKPLSKIIKNSAKAAHDQTLDIYGSWQMNIAYAYELTHKTSYFTVIRMNNFKELYKHLKQKIPVIVSIRGPIKGGALPYKNGHFVVVAGWNKEHQHVLCIDPAFKTSSRTKTSYALNDFLAAWERSRRLSYVAIPKKPLKNYRPLSQ